MFSTVHQTQQNQNLKNNIPILSIDEEILANELLIKSEFRLHTNKRELNPFIIYDDINYGNSKIKINEKFPQIKKYFKGNKTENILFKNFHKFIKFLKEFKNRLKDEFKLNYNLRIDLNFEKEGNDNIDKTYNIKCIYKFYNPDPKENDKISFVDENILFDGNNSNLQGFPYLINEINNESYEKIPYIEIENHNTNQNISRINENVDNNNNIKEKSINEDRTAHSNLIQNEANKNIDYYFKPSDETKIIEFRNVIGIHKDGRHIHTADYTKELSNGWFLSFGTDNIIKFYQEDFKQNESFKEIRDNDYIYNIIERLNFLRKNKDNIQIIGCNNQIGLFELDFEKLSLNTKNYDLSDITSVNCIEMKNNNFAIIGNNSSEYFVDLFKEKKEKEKTQHTPIILNKGYRGAIKISYNIIAITSNKVLINGEDSIIFYNVEKKKISKKMDGYSFICNPNGLALMPGENINVKNKILLCACKKYFEDQENGILLINPQLEENHEIKDPFINTGNFEVYCFCPIFIVNPENKIISDNSKGDDNNDNNLIDTDYFLVGGYDNDKCEGRIRLYEVIYNEKAYLNRIEYIQDIEFEKNEKFYEFEGPISCIIQSKRSGNILATSYDGNVYLLSNPNLNYYSKGKKIKNL